VNNLLNIELVFNPIMFFGKLISGLAGGIFELFFFIDDLSIFTDISYHLTHMSSILLGVFLHIIVAVVVFTIGVTIIEASGIRPNSIPSSIVLGILFGSSVLSIFSLPIHLILLPYTITLPYIIAHLSYGLVSYLIYYLLQRK
jgi:hypothetical protein